MRTTGCVEFLTEKDARAAGLTGVNAAGQVFMRTDNTSWNPRDSGNRTARRSVRVSSKRAYDPKTLSGGTNETGKIMFVLDVAHMPTGCAVWPSWWMNSVLGSWPEQGEVDLIEVQSLSNTRQLPETEQKCVESVCSRICFHGASLPAYRSGPSRLAGCAHQHGQHLLNAHDPGLLPGFGPGVRLYWPLDRQQGW